jgi:hypothetical protein
MTRSRAGPARLVPQMPVGFLGIPVNDQTDQYSIKLANGLTGDHSRLNTAAIGCDLVLATHAVQHQEFQTDRVFGHYAQTC